MKKIFLDFGTNKFQGYNLIKKKHGIDNTWLVHTYEANPLLFNYITENCPDGIVVHNKAVWDKNEILEFLVDTDKIEWEGSRILHKDNKIETNSNLQTVKVESIDIYDIMKEYEKDDFIIIKMDIETAEFNVLNKMIETNQMEKVDILYVEFHCRKFGEKRMKYRRLQENLLEQIRNIGVKVEVWH